MNVVLRGVNMIAQCPQCSTKYKVDDRNVSQENLQLECPTCSQVFKVANDGAGREEVEHSGAISSKCSAGVPAEAKTVLVVDDSRFFREMIFDILQPLHLNLLAASDGVEALEVIKGKGPDLVLLDLNLPKKNGFEIIREIRSAPAYEDICLLAMSGVYHKEVDAAEAKKAGANDFIKKSFRPEELQKFVKMWLIW
jgi:predicted Zn finger-like uncharacterized protein